MFDRFGELRYVAGACLLAVALAMPSLNIIRKLKGILGWIWQWSSKWPWEVISSLGFFGMVAEEEFIGAICALSLACFGSLSKLLHWRAESDEHKMVKWFSVYLGLPLMFLGLLLVTLAYKADKPYSRVPDYLASYVPLYPIPRDFIPTAKKPEGWERTTSLETFKEIDKELNEAKQELIVKSSHPSDIAVKQINIGHLEIGKPMTLDVHMINNGPNPGTMEGYFKLGLLVNCQDHDARRTLEERAWKQIIALPAPPVRELSMPIGTPLVVRITDGIPLTEDQIKLLVNNDEHTFIFYALFNGFRDVSGLHWMVYCGTIQGGGEILLCTDHNGPIKKPPFRIVKQPS